MMLCENHVVKCAELLVEVILLHGIVDIVSVTTLTCVHYLCQQVKSTHSAKPVRKVH